MLVTRQVLATPLFLSTAVRQTAVQILLAQRLLHKVYRRMLCLIKRVEVLTKPEPALAYLVEPRKHVFLKVFQERYPVFEYRHISF